MIPKSALRIAAVAAVLGAALSAQAFVITLTGDVTGNGVLNATTIQSNLVGLSNFVFTGSAPVSGNTSTITASLVGATNSLTSLTGTGFAVTAGGTTSFAGTYTAVATPGLNLGSPITGTYSGSYDGLGKFSLAIVGQPVPEPASLAALGVGALGLLRRRRKA